MFQTPAPAPMKKRCPTISGDSCTPPLSILCPALSCSPLKVPLPSPSLSFLRELHRRAVRASSAGWERLIAPPQAPR